MKTWYYTVIFKYNTFILSLCALHSNQLKAWQLGNIHYSSFLGAPLLDVL